MSDTAPKNDNNGNDATAATETSNPASSNLPDKKLSENENSTATAAPQQQTVTTAAQQVLSTEKENKQAENSEPAKNKSQENLDKTVTNSTKSSTTTATATATTSSSKNSSKTANIKQYRPSNSKVISQIATPGVGNKPVKVQYCNQRVIGNGSFGVVYKAELCGDSLNYPDSDYEDDKNSETAKNEDKPTAADESKDSTKKPVRLVAIKKVLQDKRFKNRELTIMRTLKHTNIVKLKFFFYSMGEQKDEVYLNLILEFVPENVYKVSRHYAKQKTSMPSIYVRLYMYQLLRALAYIHTSNICHRDIKPQNLLVNPQTAVLKLCDFGSAKQLVAGEPNVSYICSRYYRAPELIFGATNYTCSIDVWSAGCVLAELMLGQPI